MHRQATDAPCRPAARVLTGCIGAILLLAYPSFVRADPKADYASLFGDEEKKVLSTSSTKDDAVFAAKLLARSNDLKDAPELQRLVLERAVDLGQKDADGLPSAVEAAKQIVEKAAGADKLDWRSRLVDLYAAQYKRASGEKRTEAGNFLLDILQKEAIELAGERKYADAVKRLNEGRDIARSIRSPRLDEFMSAARQMQEKQQTAAKYDRMRERLNTQGGDVALLEQVILGYLLELNDIDTAGKLAAGHPDKTWEESIELAASKGPESASQADCLTLANWFQKLAGVTSGDAKGAALAMCVNYFDSYLRQHQEQDAARLKATVQHRDAMKELLALPSNAATKLVIWNQRNNPDRDRGTTAINVIVSRGGKTVWRRDNINIGWSPDNDVATTLIIPSIKEGTIRIEVTGWVNMGGGLSEVELIQNGVNLARGAKVTASGFLTADTSPATLTDGIKSSAVHTKGYWLLPNKVAGWAEIEFPRR